MSVAKRLIDYWKTHGASAERGAEVKALAAFEQRHGVRLPADFREYLMTADGTAPPHDTDSEGFSFWPLTKICPVPESSESAGRFPDAGAYFIFADYLQWSWAYAIRLTADETSGPIVIVGTKDGNPQRVAESFTTFAELYLQGWEHIWIK